MSLAIDFCPWLGSTEDSQTRYAEPAEGHACYAQRPAAGVALDYQAGYCLGGAHEACRFYREPPAPAAPPERVAPGEVQDEVGPAPRRFSTVQVALWALVVLAAVVVVYFYGSALLAYDGGTTPVGALSPSPAPTATATRAATGEIPAPGGTRGQASAGRTETVVAPGQAPAGGTERGPVRPTPTATPHPGGRIYALRPEAGAAGWVASDEARGNHLGDSYLYAGVFQGVTYHGLFQFDLAAVPRGATIYAGTVELTGLDARRLGSAGAWELRVLVGDGAETWRRTTYQDAHNAAVQWSLPPALAAAGLAEGQTYAFELSAGQLRDLEARLMAEQYTVSFRIDGPLAGADSLFAWDSGSGPASKGQGPRLVLSVGAAPRTPIPTGSPPPTDTPTPTQTPTPTETPVWFVVTSTPTPENAMTAAVVAARATGRATTTGTPTPLPEYVATATPHYVVVTRTPTPENYATATYRRGVATANVLLTGTPTPTPRNLATATFTPRPTRTPVLVWLDELAGTPTVTVSPTPTTPPLPAMLKNKILFLSDRGGQTEAYMLDPGTGKVALLTARWPYDVALQGENVSPDGQARAYVQNDGKGVPQVHVYSDYYGGSWQVTFNTGMSYDPVWSPAGDVLAFVSTEGGNDDVYVIGSDGTGQRRLTFNQWEWDKHPTWSPDGRQIVFWSNEGTGRRQIWIMDADGSGRRILLESEYDDWDPVWVK
jgi:hypothetical protein